MSIAPGRSRLDIKLDDGKVNKRQRKAPLAEYANFSWMMHLTECDRIDVMGISKAFQATFESPSTFCWVEACLTFQPDSVLRLLAGLEEVIDNISGMSLEYWPVREPSCIFFQDWCHALQVISEEYGSILSHRPWEFHFLDLQKPLLGQLCTKYGDTPHRDITRYIDGYYSPHFCPPNPRADQPKLQQDVQLDDEVFYDERRGLYFWGDVTKNFNNTRLFVQHAITGQRLPPAVKFDGEAHREGSLAGYGISPSGEYIILVCNIKLFSRRSLTSIWQINDGLKLTKRLRSEPWANICFSHECESSPFASPATGIGFTDDGYCLTPSGELHLASGSRRQLLNLFPKHFNSASMHYYGSPIFSQSGRYLFASQWLGTGISRSQVVRVALSAETPKYLGLWNGLRRSIVNVSPSGRFLILSPHYISTNLGGETSFFVFTTLVPAANIFSFPLVKSWLTVTQDSSSRRTRWNS